MKRSVSYFLILNLFLSIIAFSFILNIGVVSAGSGWYIKDGKAVEGLCPTGSCYASKVGAEASLNLGESTTAATPNTPPATGTPTGYSSHGYAGQAGEFIAGAENVAPKGYEWVVENGKGSWKPTGSATASSGLGYSITGILQGALWGLAAYGFVLMVGPMVGLDDADI